MSHPLSSLSAAIGRHYIYTTPNLTQPPTPLVHSLLLLVDTTLHSHTCPTPLVHSLLLLVNTTYTPNLTQLSYPITATHVPPP